MHCSKFVNAPRIVFLLLAASLPSTEKVAASNGQDPKCVLSHPSEVAILLDYSNSVGQGNFWTVVMFVRRFPDYFRMQQDLTRVAVLVFHDIARIEVDLTSDANRVRSLTPRFADGMMTRTDLALIAVKEQVFNQARPEALKIIILITDGLPTNPAATETAAADLKRNGALIYIAYVGTDYATDANVRNHINAIAGDQSRVFSVNNFDQLTENIICTFTDYVICHYQQGCAFDSRGTCVGVWYQPVVTDRTCSNARPSNTPNRQCARGDCDQICAKWPWTTPQCDASNAGQKINVGREGNTPSPKELFDTCPKTKEVVCPTSPIESTVTTRSSTTTSSTTTSPTTSSPTTKTKTTATSRKTTKPKPRTPRRPSTEPEDQTTESIGIIGLVTKPIAPKKPPLETWHIALILTLLLLVLLLIVIVVAVLVTRKKKKPTLRYTQRPPARRRWGRREPTPRSRSLTAHSKPSVGRPPPHYYDQNRRQPSAPLKPEPSTPTKPAPSSGEVTKSVDQLQRQQSPALKTFNPAMSVSPVRPKYVDVTIPAEAVTAKSLEPPPETSKLPSQRSKLSTRSPKVSAPEPKSPIPPPRPSVKESMSTMTTRTPRTDGTPQSSLPTTSRMTPELLMR